MEPRPCQECGSTTSPFFIVIGDKAICQPCADKVPKKNGKIQAPRIFIRYVCKTHNVGTYNPNTMSQRHEMPDCDIVKEETLGIIRPATYGGVNGDISRVHFQKPREVPRLMDNVNNYFKYKALRKNAIRGTQKLTPFEEKKLKRDKNRYVAPINEKIFDKRR